MVKRIIDIKLLPGEPTDGTGRVCIHLFLKDDKGSFTEPHVMQQQVDLQGQTVQVIGPMKGRIACDRKKVPTKPNRQNVVMMLMRTDEARAVTCLKCKETSEYKALMKQFEEPK